MVHHSTTTDQFAGHRFRVGDWLVDPATLRISKGDEIIRLEPKAMSVLVYLAARANEVVSRQELEATVWAGTVVGYDALSNAINKLRKAFGDRARNPDVIETIAKSGFRLIAEVVPADPENVAQLPPASIAVLPFDNMSGDPDQEYFSNGLSEDITTDLSKLSDLLVIARNSAFAYKGRSVAVADICRELGVRYVLEGSVRRVGQRIRINAQLIDGTTGGHIWADRYDRDLSDIFSLQDEVTSNITAAILPALGQPTDARPRQFETRSFEAYDYYLRGRELALLDTEKSIRKARTLLQRAIDLDPAFSSAYSYLARCYAVSDINSWGNQEQQSLRKALELGQKAIDLNPENPHAHFTTGTSALWLKMIDLARREVGESIRLDPNFSDGHSAMSMIEIYAGEPIKALDSLEAAMTVDPHYRDINLHLLGQAYFHLGRYRDAVAALQRRLVRKPESDISRVLLASAYGHLGEFDNGRREWKSALRINPEYSIEQKRSLLPYSNPADFESIVDGLKRSGLLHGR